MFGEFFRFELKYQFRSPLLWLVAVCFGLLGFFATATDFIQIGSAIGNVHRNAPTVVITLLAAFSLLSMFLIPLFIANTLLRDTEMGTAELFFASPMRKFDYLFGRLAAGTLVSVAILVFVASGMMLGQFMPWIDPKRLGEFSLQPFAYGFLVMVLPNLLFGAALLALLAATTRSLMAVYIGVMAFFVLRAIAGRLTVDLDNVWIGALLDPFGGRALDRALRYWSAEERNTRLPDLAGFVIANRALWAAIAAGLYAATYFLFKPMRAGTGSKRGGKGTRAGAVAADARPVSATRPATRPRFDFRASLAQFWRQLRFDTWGVLRSIPFLVMLIFGLINFLFGARFIDSLFGTKVYPVTYLMLETLQGTFGFLLFLIVTFYAGELVWKERQAKLGDVTDAMPVPNWVPLASKAGAVLAVVLIFGLAGVLAAMAFQVSRGYTVFEVGLYAQALLIGSIPSVLIGLLGVAVQVYTNNKFLGYLVVILVFLSQIVLAILDLNHNLYQFAAAPLAPYSDMNGWGHYLKGALWFYGYWMLFTLILLLLAAAFWVRGTAPTGRERWQDAKARLRGGLGAALALALVAWISVGGWIFYNTNILNTYRAEDTALDLQARYEREYGRYKDLPQPRITAVETHVEIYPEQRRAEIQGTYHLVNKHDSAIAELHVLLLPQLEWKALEFAPADLATDDKDLGYRIYKLKEPMAPGAAMDFRFTVAGEEKGFGNGILQTQVVGNGSFFNSGLLPQFGYNDNGQIVDRNERRKRDLGEAPRMPKLEDESARANTYISDDADWIAFNTTVCTVPDQIALAPGYLKKETNENGRRCFAYEMDRPMLAFWAYLSARWEVKKDSWNGIPIEIYYDRAHAFNVDRMIEGSKDSLAYFTEHFTPYQHKQVRILEFPRYERFAQSFANTIPYSESIGFIADLRDPEAVDYVYYVTAHEIAHQWWAHQVIGANVQGSTVLSESLAQYSALMVMEKKYGRERMRKFLKYELDRYLSDRGGELVEELPLYRVENQPYIHYRKGSLVFYRLREEIGEPALNRALKKFLEDKGYQQPPYTTSAELLAYIRAESPADKQAVITDLFEKITFYDNRVLEAAAKKRDDGKYEVTLKLQADKRYADGLGKETPAELGEDVEIGVFARKPGADEADETVLLLQKHRISERNPVLTLVVDAEPYEAGIDPYNKFIDRVPSDNRKRVALQ